eukprot:TRINITY_DN5226_c0_g1_i4.p1 TRINITY_DN5226_c0_g1~~TRINITY_DN5226_c0_g1_i4.p1  ORF type:complete len:845 (-),score=321.85 TRINITY_DN5226_c0_g1_i4:102-2636(-)
MFDSQPRVRPEADPPAMGNIRLAPVNNVPLVGPNVVIAPRPQVIQDHEVEGPEVADKLLQDDGLLLAHPEIKGKDPEPSMVITQFKEHQRISYDFMLKREAEPFRGCAGGLLLDDAGLGKTLTLLALICKGLFEQRKKKIREKKKEDEKKGKEEKKEKEEKKSKSKKKKVQNRKRFENTTLIICPSHIIHVWGVEIKKHLAANCVSVFEYHGSKRKNIWKTDDEYDIILTSYAVVRREADIREHEFSWVEDSIFDFMFGRIILDEAHFIRNDGTSTSRAVRHIEGRRKWAVTATPVQNKIDDIFPYLQFLGIFETKSDWKGEVVSVMKSNPQAGFKKLQVLLLKIAIRRRNTILKLPPRKELNEEVELTKIERDFYDALFAYCQSRVKELLTFMESRMGRKLTGAEQTKMRQARMNVVVLILRLRQASCHPMLVIYGMRRLHSALENNEEDRENQNQGESYYAQVLKKAAEKLQTQSQAKNKGDDKVKSEYEDEDECPVCVDAEPDSIARPCGHRCCASCWKDIMKKTSLCPVCRTAVTRVDRIEEAIKMEAKGDRDFDEIGNSLENSSKLSRLMKLLENEKEKVVVISQWREMLNITANAIRRTFPKLKFIQLDGTIPPPARGELVDKFQVDDSLRLCLLSLHSAAEGITLTAATKVYHLDPWWNPAKSFQASSRVYRIGQTQSVSIVHLHTKESIEDQIEELQKKKQKISVATVGEGKVSNDMTWVNEVKLLFKLDGSKPEDGDEEVPMGKGGGVYGRGNSKAEVQPEVKQIFIDPKFVRNVKPERVTGNRGKEEVPPRPIPVRNASVAQRRPEIKPHGVKGEPVARLRNPVGPPNGVIHLE